MDNNAYLLVCRQTRDALLIDAANDADRLLALLEGQQPAVRLIGIVTTHRHADHWQALAEIVTATGAPVLAGAADAGDLPVPVATRLQHGDRIAVGSVMLGVIALRGHTPGSVAIRYVEPSGSTHLFTGDSLFPGGPGRTASPEDFTSLMNDLEARVFDELPDDTWVYPGHGDDTTLGAERPHLAEWRARGW
jgi:glyoxylase-like metal-dependent hydrolase (beta-lactamase superfamily II)